MNRLHLLVLLVALLLGLAVVSVRWWFGESYTCVLSVRDGEPVLAVSCARPQRPELRFRFARQPNLRDVEVRYRMLATSYRPPFGAFSEVANAILPGRFTFEYGGHRIVIRREAWSLDGREQAWTAPAEIDCSASPP